MATKPYLILELDSHTADAGIDTRVEAFLDIIDGYRTSKITSQKRYDNGYRFVNNGREPVHILNTRDGKRIPIISNDRVKVLLSNMGSISTDLVAAVLRGAGLKAKPLPVATFRTLQAARAHASGKECVPLHLVLGSALQFLASDEYRRDEIYLLFVPITTGPCRTGQYYVFLENLFRDLGIENVIVFTLSADNSYTEFGPSFSKELWLGLTAADYLKDIQNALRACAADSRWARQRFDELYERLIAGVQEDSNRLLVELESFAADIGKVPLERTLDDCSKVLVVGEIYVRRDDFAVEELVQRMSSRNIVVKISGICEWIHYLDFVREYDLRKRIRLAPKWRRLVSRETRDLARLKLEMGWKRLMERKIKKALSSSRLIPSAPHDMKKIMAMTASNFVDLELNSEIAVSSGAAATAMAEGYSGVVNISPFACLIGRVIEGVYTPWSRERDCPVISVEVDGNPLPPNTIGKLDVFMVNVLRHRAARDGADFVEAATGQIDGEIVNREEDPDRLDATESAHRESVA